MAGKEDTKNASGTRASSSYPVGALLRLTFVQLLRTRQVGVFLAVLLVPVAFSIYWSLAVRFIDDVLLQWGGIFVVAYMGFIVPFAGLIYGTTLISAETEAGTLTYLVTRPVPRWLIVLVKYMAAAAVCIAGLLLSMLVAYGMLALHFGFGPLVTHAVTWLKYSGIACLGVAVYLALFLFAGMVLRRPVVVGLVFVVVWEGLVAIIPKLVRFATVMHYLRSLVIYATEGQLRLPRLFVDDPAPLVAAIVVPVVLLLAALALSLWHFTRAEFHTNPQER